jgi:CheY-like chemotaxis protein
MKINILCVDDDPNILHGYKRSFRKQYDMHIAIGPEAGLQAVKNEGPFAVIVSDYAMPGMNGVEFLTQVKKIDPNSVRMMLTGFANMDNAIQAINEGNIFRFLTKPCEPEALARSLDDGIAQYRLVMAEKELLEETLFGSVRVMSQILSLVNPIAFSSTSRIKFYMKHLASELDLPGKWRFELAAMLCELGCITLPSETLLKISASQDLTQNEQDIYDAHPGVAADLLKNIPRMAMISKMVQYQRIKCSEHQNPNDRTLPQDTALLGGYMLHTALDFDHLSGQNMSISKIIEAMRSRKGIYHPAILDAMASVERTEHKMEVRAINIRDIKAFMLADEEIRTKSGLLLMVKGQEVTKATLERLRSFHKTAGIEEPVRMQIPL